LTPIRFHLDEHVADAIALGLRRRGLDVTTTTEVGLSGASDVDQLAHGLAEMRVVVTFDKHFPSLHYRGIAHSGIVYSPRNRRTIGEILDFLELLHRCEDAPRMIGRIEYL
jgi:hypothetical protein